MELLICFNIFIMRIDAPSHIRPLRLNGLPAELRNELKEARAKYSWSQRELGAKIGLPQPHISGIESGEIVPRFDTLLDIVRILGLDLLLVPRSLVPAVQSLIRAHIEPESEEKSLYAIDAQEPPTGKKDRDEF